MNSLRFFRWEVKVKCKFTVQPRQRLFLLSGEKGKVRSERQVVSILSISHIAQHLFLGVPILYESIILELGLSYTQIGIVAAIGSVLSGFLQIVYSLAGRVIPRRLLIAWSSFSTAIGCFLTGVAVRFENVLGGTTLAGIGQAGPHPVSSSIISQKFDKKRIGLGLSLFYGLGYIGTITSPVLLSTIAIAGGWRASYYALGIVLLACAALTFIGLRGEVAGDKASSEGTNRKFLSDVKSSFAVKGVIPILIAQVFASGGTGMGVMTTWVSIYLRDPAKGFGLGIWEAGLISSLATIGGVLGTIYFGRVADKRGYLKISIISLVVATFTIYLLSLYSGFSLLIVPHLFILSLTTFPLTSLLQAHLASVSSTSQRDILLGLFLTLGFGVSSVWSAFLGSVVDTFSFVDIWYVMALAGIGAIICLIIAYRDFRTEQH